MKMYDRNMINYTPRSLLVYGLLWSEL